VLKIGDPVEVMNMSVCQGDLIHADRHGALVIPTGVVSLLKNAIEKVIDSEAIVLVPAREPGFNIEKLEEVWAQFEAART
jgi:regulator of RNase E activity RraA